MREIKVRGYSKVYKKWIYGYGVYHIKMSDNYVHSTGIKYTSRITNEKGTHTVVTESVGEYTNINDDNGQDIYEGHIVKSESVLFGRGNVDFFGKVKMLEGQWVIDNGENATPLWSETNELTVLGSEYDLVKDGKGVCYNA